MQLRSARRPGPVLIVGCVECARVLCGVFGEGSPEFDTMAVLSIHSHTDRVRAQAARWQ